MTLSKEQIALIRKLIASQGFTHYDIQNEIIDHLASAIEEKMEAEPERNLGEITREVYESFGVDGFNKMEDTFRKSVQKKHRKRYWSTLSRYFTIEKYGLGFLVAFTFYFLFQSDSYASWVLRGSLLGFTALSSLVLAFKFYRKKYHRKYTVRSNASKILLISLFFPLMLISRTLSGENLLEPNGMFPSPQSPIGLTLIFSFIVLDMLTNRALLAHIEEEVEEIERLDLC